jgi:hypothetical protein
MLAAVYARIFTFARLVFLTHMMEAGYHARVCGGRRRDGGTVPPVPRGPARTQRRT